MALARLSTKKFELVVQETQGPGDAQTLATNAREHAYDLIVIAGGDGTVNEVINGVSSNSTPLAVLPTGTANVLAAELGAPSTASGFARLLTNGEVQTAWAGTVNGRRFMLMCSIGFDANDVARAEGGPKRLLGKGAYETGALREWLTMREPVIQIEVDGHSYSAACAVIAKGRYYAGHFELCPQARISKPNFEVCLLTSATRADIVRYGVGLYRGNLHRQPGVRVISAANVRFLSPGGVPIQLDGDIRALSPAAVSISPVPLQFLKPANS